MMVKIGKLYRRKFDGKIIEVVGFGFDHNDREIVLTDGYEKPLIQYFFEDYNNYE